jgi:hypothetical protein
MADRRFGRKKNLGQCSIGGCAHKSHCRELCQKHYTRWRLTGTTDKPIYVPREWRTCSIDGCKKPSRTREGKLCEVHYVRHYRTGTYDKIDRRKRCVSPAGYIFHRDPTHPASSSNGHLYEHRMICYDAIGAGAHPCHWCGREVRWDVKGNGTNGTNKLVIDHLDNNKQNNSIDNLKPSCHRCNATRGLFMSWVLKHKDDPWLRVLFENIKRDL